MILWQIRHINTLETTCLTYIMAALLLKDCHYNGYCHVSTTGPGSHHLQHCDMSHSLLMGCTTSVLQPSLLYAPGKVLEPGLCSQTLIDFPHDSLQLYCSLMSFRCLRSDEALVSWCIIIRGRVVNSTGGVSHHETASLSEGEFTAQGESLIMRQHHRDRI
jgi:hypothetical protein